MEWITRYFTPEKEDYEVLENVDSLLASGGMIYCALEDGRVLAVRNDRPSGKTVSGKSANWRRWDSIREKAQAAQFLFLYGLCHCTGAKSLLSYPTESWKPALYIYRKCGFQETALDKSYWGLERADIAFEYLIPNEKI